jgi:hypothetical protein
MIDMSKVPASQGYASKAGYGQVYTPRTAAKGTKMSATGTPQAAAPAPSQSGDPYGGQMWTPAEWGEQANYARAAMNTPYQAPAGIGMGYSGIQDLYGQGGYLTDANRYKTANDAVFKRGLEEEKQKIMQQMHGAGYGDSSVMGSQLMRGIGDRYLNRDLAYADKDLGLQEAAKGRLMQGLGMLPGMASVENQAYGDWANRGRAAAGDLGAVGDKYWNAPMDYALKQAQLGGMYNQNSWTPEMAYYGQVMNPGQAQPASYTPGIASQIFGAATSMLPYMPYLGTGATPGMTVGNRTGK